jgi:hypothetical protein
MLSQIGPSFEVFSNDVFSFLLPAILAGGTVYVAVSLTQGRGPFQTESARPEPGPTGTGNPVLRTLYALAVAVLVAAFVGFGIETFYPTPESPQDTALAGEIPPSPSADKNVPSAAEPPPGLPGDAASGAYERQLADHDRVASVVAIVVAVLILVVGLIPRISLLPVIGDGVTLGGVLTLFYGMALALQAPSGVLGFFVVAVGLIALLATLYLKFRPGRTVSP